MHAGIRIGEEGFYDPTAGERKKKNQKPTYEGYPVLATDPGQPKVTMEVIGRTPHVDRSERALQGSSATVDKDEPGVVESKPTGRRRKKVTEDVSSGQAA